MLFLASTTVGTFHAQLGFRSLPSQACFGSVLIEPTLTLKLHRWTVSRTRRFTRRRLDFGRKRIINLVQSVIFPEFKFNLVDFGESFVVLDLFGNRQFFEVDVFVESLFDYDGHWRWLVHVDGGQFFHRGFLDEAF